jgi:hypothetical protein
MKEACAIAAAGGVRVKHFPIRPRHRIVIPPTMTWKKPGDDGEKSR